jgi:hypothetical protein
MNQLQKSIAKEGDRYLFHLECIFSDVLQYSNCRAVFQEEPDTLMLIVIHSDNKGGEREVFKAGIRNQFSKKEMIETFLIETAKTAFEK